MKKQIENIKRNWKSESKKAAFVILGFVGGQALSKGIDWLAQKYPQLEPAVKFGKPVVLAGGGWLLTNATSPDQLALKYIGYGLQTAGAFEGVKLIPIAKDFLNGVDDNISGTYYMENEKPLLELGTFGINALPVKSLDMENAPEMRLELPELDGLNLENMSGTDDENISGSDLGYDPDKFDGIL